MFPCLHECFCTNQGCSPDQVSLLNPVYTTLRSLQGPCVLEKMPAMSTAVLSAGPVMVPPSRVPGVLCSKSKLIARDSTGLVKGLWFRSQPQKVVIQCQASAVSWRTMVLHARRFVTSNVHG